jgi:hypothetical protein
MMTNPKTPPFVITNVKDLVYHPPTVELMLGLEEYLNGLLTPTESYHGCRVYVEKTYGPNKTRRLRGVWRKDWVWFGGPPDPRPKQSKTLLEWRMVGRKNVEVLYVSEFVWVEGLWKEGEWVNNRGGEERE